MELFATCRTILLTDAIAMKLALAASLYDASRDGRLIVDRANTAPDVAAPGRPVLPELVPPQTVPRRGLGTPQSSAALLHAIAHIEFNAIHLAIDACARFRAMPDGYYRDWVLVAAEEAKHFALLAALLEQRGFAYGSFPAHDGLWALAARTAGDVLARMALVPRIMEARGLDVTPAIRARFASRGDHEAAAVLDVILTDEVGHVAIGNRWFRVICGERGLDPDTVFEALSREHDAPGIHPPLNRAARLAGGFTADELDRFEAGARRR